MKADISTRDRRVHVELMYPDLPESDNAVQVDVCAVRVVEPIRVHFCFERNSWVISREICRGETSDWVEVALLPASFVSEAP